MRSAIAAAMKTLRRVAGAAVTYRRGATEVELRAALGRTEYDELDAGGLVIRQQRRDYLVKASELILAGAVILPQEGDDIVETDGERTYTYEVLPGPGGETWRYSDPFRETLRIHTKLRSAA